MQELHDRFATLTLSEDDLDFDFIVDQLASLKAEIDGLEMQLDGEESWLIEWLNAEHYKGALLYVGAKTNYRKEIADGRAFPFNPTTRAALCSRFNAWSATARGRLALYGQADPNVTVVKPWLAELAKFKANPVSTP